MGTIVKIALGLFLGFFLVVFALVALIALGEEKEANSVNRPGPVTVGDATPTATTTTVATTTTTPCKVDLNHFSRIRIGVPYFVVKSAFGCPGTELSRSTLVGMTTTMYEWQGRDFATVTMMFQNDKLITKSQFGLK